MFHHICSVVYKSIFCDNVGIIDVTITIAISFYAIITVVEISSYDSIIYPVSTDYLLTIYSPQMGYTDRREVKQFQFTAWPDHGVPEHSAPFLQFIRRIHVLNTPDRSVYIPSLTRAVHEPSRSFTVLGE